MEIIKLNGIEFYKKELENLYFNEGKKFIIKYKTIYQLKYSENGGFSTLKIYQNNNKNDLGYTRRGRFIVSKADLVNRLLERELVTD